MVLVEDECRIQRESSLQSIWQQKGQQEVIKVDQKKEGTSFYGALDVKTGKCHLWDTDKQNSLHTVVFLKQLADYYQGKHIFLIWDGAPWHRGEVKKYLKNKYKKCKLTLMYFPPYSPELNPQEHVWKRAKQTTVHNSEEPYEEKLYQFRQFIAHHKFTTNFLNKYASS